LRCVREMKKTIALLLIILLPTLIAAQVRQNRSIVFNRVTIIDVKNAASKSGMTVIIKGRRIAAIGKTGKVKIPKDAEIIDASGKFLIPGLWDMHAHFGTDDFDKNAHLRLFIINGVTGIRIMDGEPEYHSWRKEAESGNLLAPRMLIASRIIGFGDLSNISEAATREEVRRAKQEGADFIKVHDYVLRESYFALIDEAKRLNLSVEGHVPTSITAAEAAQAGQKSIEHFTGLDEAKADDKKAESLALTLKKNRTWLCPTIIMRSNYASLDNTDFANDSRLKYVKPSWKKRWLNMTKDSVKTPIEEWSKRRETVRKEKALIGKMQRAGVGILAGTDTANPYVFPGFSLHDELAMLVEAGLTPMQALQAATFNAAKFFNKSDSLGTIEKGKLADLVLLDANPLENIGNTKKINSVVLNGRLFDRNDLDKMLADIEDTAKNK
jgi:imidazolonepropionase-like amidohydrolase